MVEDSWTLLKDILKTPRWGASAVIVDRKLYVVGGRGSFCERTVYPVSIEVFKVSGLHCAPVCDDLPLDLKQARTDHVVLSRSGVLYVIGGIKCSSILDSCESIDTTSALHYDMANMHKCRGGLAAVILEDHIIALGGQTSFNKGSQSVESFSFVSKQWTFIESMISSRYDHCACVFNNKIFVLGGHGSSTIEVYDPLCKKWKVHEKLSVRRFRCSIVEVEFA